MCQMFHLRFSHSVDATLPIVCVLVLLYRYAYVINSGMITFLNLWNFYGTKKWNADFDLYFSNAVKLNMNPCLISALQF